MSLSTYLVQRGARGTWQLRVPIPRALHAPGKPKERVKSMGTTDRRIASDRALAVLDEWKREWATARGEVVAMPAGLLRPTSDVSVPALVLAQHEALLQRLEDQRRALPADDEAQDAEMAKRAADLRRLTRRHADGDDASFRAMADRMISARSLPIVSGTTEYEALVAGLAESAIEALAIHQRRYSGELDVEPRSALIREERQRKADKAKPGETLLELFDRYAEQRLAEGRKRDDTLKQDRKVIEQFAAFVGTDRAITSIKPEHVRDYRDTLRQLPPKWRDRADMRGLSMREAAAKARLAEMPRTALSTVNKHLSTISPLFAWLIKERWDLSNPCNGLFHDKVRGKNPRPPLGTDRLNKVLASPLFSGFEADGKEHRPGEVCSNDWRYWIPLLCLFTGMRIGEAAQLRAEDVSKHDSGAWVIDIQHAPAKGQTTKSGQSRASVAHTKLVELGFVKFVEERRKAGGDSRLFPELVANDRDQLGAEPSAFWRDYLTRIGVKSGADGLGAHSFRHELADRLRVEVGLVDDQIAVALGHDQKSTTAGYGAVRQGTVRFLAPVIVQVRFDGVEFGNGGLLL
ncbi:integrase [Sphingomonas endophytica]|uniref:Integrase n=1 Tax=Sphingomonas endophytica TaxID=869719 RepID=A0ABR6N0T1_9SPHN|nr:tyrosine-type recombinase/integrase [Sphingomonas endophytica]MBB5724387.1 integrase [Sphingomonas endophytica]